MTVPDYPDWQDPQAHATAISTTGVPLLGAPANLVTDLLRTIPGGGNEQYTDLPVTQTGYAGQLTITYPVAATNPFCEVQLIWGDSASATVIATETYYVAGGLVGAPMQTLAGGIAKADQLTVIVTNLDLAQTATVSIVLDQDSVTRPDDRWYWRNAVNASGSVAGLNLMTLPDDELSLGYLHTATVPAGTTNSWLAGMAPGRLVQLGMVCTGVTASNIVVQVQAAPTSVYTGAGICLYQLPTALGFSYQYIGTRSPVLLKVTNLATTGTLSFSAMMTSQV